MQYLRMYYTEVCGCSKLKQAGKTCKACGVSTVVTSVGKPGDGVAAVVPKPRKRQ